MTWNFSAGPSMLPQEVMQQAQEEFLDWQGLEVSVIEVSHRSQEFEAMAEKAKERLRQLLLLPDDYEILFTTGGAQAQFAFVPMNLLQPEEEADYLITGGWSERAAREAARFARIHVAASNETSGFSNLPPRETWQLNPASKYFHFASNETVHGLQFHTLPRVPKPMVIDMSSDILSKPIDFTGVGLIYAGAQKNIGPAGLTLVILQREYLSKLSGRVPTVFDYGVLSQFQSLANTPSTLSWYLAGLVFEWIERHGGLAGMAKRNAEKAAALYACIDQSALYFNQVEPSCRSQMSVVFDLKDASLLPKFLSEARQAGFIGIKGHKIRGGVRASLYNPMPIEGVLALIAFMKEFEKNA